VARGAIEPPNCLFVRRIQHLSGGGSSDKPPPIPICRGASFLAQNGLNQGLPAGGARRAWSFLGVE
jgi:hypothetical protein